MMSVTTLPIAQPVPGAHEVTVCTLVEVIVSVMVVAPNVVVVDGTDGSSLVKDGETLEVEEFVIGYGTVVVVPNPLVELPETVEESDEIVVDSVGWDEVVEFA